MAEPKLVDQSDILALNAQLTADLATAKQTIGTLTAANATLATAQAEVSKLTADCVVLNSLAATAKAEVATLTAANAALTEKMADFNKTLAAELSKHGIRPVAVSVSGSTTATGDKKELTATEKVLLAKGLPVGTEVNLKLS